MGDQKDHLAEIISLREQNTLLFNLQNIITKYERVNSV
jgi:hypothetical protein